MKYLVVSDNHGDRSVIERLFARYKNEVDEIFHCGDSELPSNDSLWQGVHIVTGNCDYDRGYEASLTVETPLDRVLVTHGHLYDVRFGLYRLSLKALEEKANLVFFGHTHVIGCEKVGNTLFLNPGSISQPRGTIQEKSYCIVESTAEAWTIQYYRADFTLLPELTFEFKK
ncbi:metallophosphoesterase [Enterococcus sp.]|uniref:metallophosphoesterase n=1 Tax=Enterococcus sp. TaxID=35783 RepID=UPI002FCABBBE